MGNLPVLSKKSAVQFGEYSEITKGKFSLRSFRPYDMSCEDLRPILSAEGRGRSLVEEDGTGRDSATILGLEMDPEMVGFTSRFFPSIFYPARHYTTELARCNSRQYIITNCGQLSYLLAIVSVNVSVKTCG